MPSHRATRLDHAVPPEVARAVDELAARSGQSRAAVWLTALATIIGRYTRQHALVLGVAHDGLPPQDDPIGPHGDALPLPLSFAGEPSVREACARTGAALAEQARGRSVSLADLVEALQPARDPGRAPLFQVLFAGASVPRAGRCCRRRAPPRRSISSSRSCTATAVRAWRWSARRIFSSARASSACATTCRCSCWAWRRGRRRRWRRCPS
ncbi:MAG: hypothetical protein WKG00_31965 [Polyangiaceae bacterium]